MCGVFESLNRAISVLVLLGIAVSTPAADRPTFVVHGPTIIAFFAPVAQKEVDTNPDANEALGDFQYYAANAVGPLQKAGITFHQAYAPSFRVRLGTRVVAFRPGKTKVGYYFVAPGKKPRIEYGVVADVGLFEIARDYFGIAVE